MRIYLSVDIEGINGIVHSSQTQPGEPGYERAVTLMHAETNAVIEGLVASGATEVLVNDSHYDMRNLRIEDLHPKARLVNGWQKPFSMVSQVNVEDSEKIAACGFVGYHSRAGTPDGVLSHTYRSQVFLDVKVNGESVGETGLNGYLAGYFGVPVAFITGDDAACREAHALLGDKLTSVAVKKAISRYSAISRPQGEVLKELKEKAGAAIKNQGSWRLLKPPSPATMELTMFDPAMCDGAELIPGVKRLSERSVSFSDADYSVVFRLMLAIGAIGASRRDPHF